MKTGVLVNLGTPDRPDVPAVRRSRRIPLGRSRPRHESRVEVASPLRHPAVPSEECSGVPEGVGFERGSPLLFHSQDLTASLQAALGGDYEVRLAMRYGQPDLPSALDALEAAGCGRLIVVPLYPQYASSSTGSTHERVMNSWGGARCRQRSRSLPISTTTRGSSSPRQTSHVRCWTSSHPTTS